MYNIHNSTIYYEHPIYKITCYPNKPCIDNNTYPYPYIYKFNTFTLFENIKMISSMMYVWGGYDVHMGWLRLVGSLK